MDRENKATHSAASTAKITEVNSFWGGERLTALEMLCMHSFLAHGVGYNLYVYDEPDQVPAGVQLRDARAILPADQQFVYPHGTFNSGSLAGFSNLFRYTLLETNGGCWVDTDVCCLEPFDAQEFYVRQQTQNGGFLVASCLFNVQPRSPVLRHCREVSARKERAKVVHGETGPLLFTEAIKTCGSADAVRDAAQFLPLPWWEYHRLFSDEEVNLKACAAVHFWNAMLRSDGLDKDARYPASSVYERLKQHYL